MTENFLRAYIDDLTCFSKGYNDHLQHLKLIFERTREIGFRFNPQKCVLFRREVNLFGFIVSAEGIHLDPKKIDKILNFPIPKSKTDIRAFVNLAGYYRRHVQGFAEIAAPINNLLKKGIKENWSDEAHIAFTNLKTVITRLQYLCIQIRKNLIDCIRMHQMLDWVRC